MSIFLLLSVLVATVSTSAPGDEESFCTNDLEASAMTPPPVYSPNSRILMDSYNYINLLPPHDNSVWQQVDNDDNNIAGRGTSVSLQCIIIASIMSISFSM